MKLLALRLCEHDSNISYYDGYKLHYFKSERSLQIKHHGYSNVWEWRDVIKQQWNVDASDIDEIAIVFDPWLHKLPTNNEKFFPAIEYQYFPAPCKVWRVNHHYAHYLSCWPLAPRADIGFIFDGFGDRDVSWTVLNNDRIIDQGSVEKNGSLGLEMSKAGDILGIDSDTPYDVSGKTMGLQAYGNINQPFLEKLKQYDLHQTKKIFDLQLWEQHIGSTLVANLQLLDWIKTVHYYIEEALVSFFKKYTTTEKTIFYSGGVAQNVIWNTSLRKEFPNIIIPPHCADDGLSLGAMEWLRIKNNIPPFQIKNFPYIQSDISPNDTPTKETIKSVAKFLADGKIVAWYQQHGEIGPRALGNRSILLDPRQLDGKNKINSVKNREKYRPFGASILAEHKRDFFKDSLQDKFMLYVSELKNDNFPCITHVDKTCRVQTVDSTNEIFYNLLSEFYQLTGCPILLNTSLNNAGKPIAGSPDDAHQFFQKSKTDILVVGNQIFTKYNYH